MLNGFSTVIFCPLIRKFWLLRRGRYVPCPYYAHQLVSKLCGSDSRYIHVLDDDSLLNIFYLYRLDVFDEGEANNELILHGGRWSQERWWYKIAQVC